MITLGDGNYVNVKHQDMFQKLSELKEALTESTTLSDTEKLELAVDIETLKDQLVKPQPDREVVGRLWPRIEKAAALAGLGSLALELGQLAQKLLQ